MDTDRDYSRVLGEGISIFGNNDHTKDDYKLLCENFPQNLMKLFQK